MGKANIIYGPNQNTLESQNGSQFLVTLTVDTKRRLPGESTEGLGKVL